MKTELEFLNNLKNLTTSELRSLNRYYLHPKNQRCCSKCFKIYDNYKDNFHIKKHTGNHISYNTRCASCVNDINRQRTEEYRKSPTVFIASRFKGYVSRAKTQNVPFNLTKEYLTDLWNKQQGLCFYTEKPICFTLTTESGKHPHLYTPSLDKQDPKLGYVEGNVVWCSYLVNRMKNDLTEAEFYETCKTIVKLQEK